MNKSKFQRTNSLPGNFNNVSTAGENHATSPGVCRVCTTDGHKIDRFAIKEVICRICCKRQSSKKWV